MKGDVLYSSVGISFWGGIDPLTGNVIDTTHPLHGECISNKILVIPSGRGSCTGSQVMLELILNGKAPRAIILRDPDSILCTGAIIAEEFFHDECKENIPIISAIGEDNFTKLLDDKYDSLSIEVLCEEDICIHNGEDEILAKDLLKLKNTVGTQHVTTSKAEELALQTIKRVASISNTKDMIPISSAHIDAVTYIGQGGLRFVKKLVELGGKVKVNTTLNSQSCDRRRWKELGVDESLAHNANSIGDSYLDLGCELSFTCAPYLLASKPKKGDNICWGESNAVVYSNSVIGARTEKYADYFDICAAICGVVPNTGVHIEENRAPTIVIDATTLIQNLLPSIKANNDLSYDKQGFDSFFPTIGWICGYLSNGGIPLILGFDQLPAVSNDNLKAFCSSYGTTGSSPLFHMAQITPEAMDNITVNTMIDNCDDKYVEVTKEDLCNAYETLDSGNENDISLVALGNPHLRYVIIFHHMQSSPSLRFKLTSSISFSVDELAKLSELIEYDDRPKHESVKVMATLGRHVQSIGNDLGYIQKLESFGVELVNDTCWCMLLDPPIIPSNPNSTILTNSGKYSHYGPGLNNRNMRFGSMYDCISAAKSGKLSSGSSLPQWLRRSFSTHQIIRTIKTII